MAYCISYWGHGDAQMRFWAGVTDNRWYEFVRQRNCDEVNFWQPSGRPPFVNLPPGTPFLFKLKRPHNCIAGGGHFVRYTRLPLSVAWDVFAEQNGASSFRGLHDLIAANAADPPGPNPDIGCTAVTDVFFLPREKWIPVDDLFAKSIMRGRIYDTAKADGEKLWALVQAAQDGGALAEEPPMTDVNRFGEAFLTRARLGQSSFRTLVIDAYGRKCALTGESTLPVLEAAHIRPYSDHGPHAISNGLLLRSDFHKLFDAGLITVEPDYKIRVSTRIRGQYFNGKAYYRLEGQELATMPERALDRPNPEFLRWHNHERFAA
jgi:putative restriction endonuclease